MNIYGIINEEAELVQSPTFCTWQFQRYEEDGSLRSYLGFECISENLIPENGQVITNFRDWLHQFTPEEI